MPNESKFTARRDEVPRNGSIVEMTWQKFMVITFHKSENNYSGFRQSLLFKANWLHLYIIWYISSCLYRRVSIECNNVTFSLPHNFVIRPSICLLFYTNVSNCVQFPVQFNTNIHYIKPCNFSCYVTIEPLSYKHDVQLWNEKISSL